ncbi:MAG TPA: OB-fold domain-containing protein [Acidimicrobiales bacterium]|nr:OB-fold domain-containing protein [Acidimicrobiales bacterium]
MRLPVEVFGAERSDRSYAIGSLALWFFALAGAQPPDTVLLGRGKATPAPHSSLKQCGHYVHYPRPICEECLSTDLAPEQVSGKGSLYSYTVVVQPFHPYFVDKVPYVLAVVELVEQAKLKITTNIVECAEEELHVAMPVEAVFRTLASDLTLPLFRPSERLAGSDPTAVSTSTRR